MRRVADKGNAAEKECAINPEIPSEYCQWVYLHALLEDVSGNKASSVYYFFRPIFLFPSLPI